MYFCSRISLYAISGNIIEVKNGIRCLFDIRECRSLRMNNSVRINNGCSRFRRGQIYLHFWASPTAFEWDKKVHAFFIPPTEDRNIKS